MSFAGAITSEFVVFMKASPERWGKMPDNEKKSNTLYFVTGDDLQQGKLYLGNILIADGAGLTSMSLNALTDIKFTNSIEADQVLMVGEDGKWTNVSLSEQIGNLVRVFKGATEEAAGTSGLVPQPKAGDQVRFLRGDGVWADPTGGVDFSAFEQKVNKFVGNNWDSTVTIIAQTEAKNAVANLVAGAPEAFDTLKEIADWIETHEEATNVLSQMKIDITNLKATTKTLNEWKESHTEAFNNLTTTVSSLQTTINANTKSISSLNQRVSAMENNLKWQVLQETPNE